MGRYAFNFEIKNLARETSYCGDLGLALLIAHVGISCGCWYVINNVGLVYLKSLRAGAWV